MNEKDLTLGITTVGDLLLNNKITSIEGQEDSLPVSLTIPDYQRPYKWTARNVCQLLDDIDDAMTQGREVYRVGTLILHHEKKSNGEDCYNIVDGQQRTITFALILQCMQEDVQAGDVPFLKREKLSSNPYNIHNVRNNYRAIKRRLGMVSGTVVKDSEAAGEEKHRSDLLGYIKGHCQFIVVITENQTEAFQFFDSQNARGKALYPHDLLKAYHLREMSGVDSSETERIVRKWEDLDQGDLASLFNQYLYRLKCWIHGNKAKVLNEETLGMFKGITSQDNNSYAQYYKSAYAYSHQVNRSSIPFVTGLQQLPEFQIDAPVIAGEPFFAYAQHYYAILKDIQDNDRYEGFLIKDNEIIKTLDQDSHKERTGDRITRFLLDTAILLYVDRFCPARPSSDDSKALDRFVVYAFIWAYSLRIQYYSVGWNTAQNYIMGNAREGTSNDFNLYKIIAEAESPNALFHQLSDLLQPVPEARIHNLPSDLNKPENGVYKHYLHFFMQYEYWNGRVHNG